MATIWYNSSHVFLKNSSKITGQKNMSGEGESYLDQAKSSFSAILPVYVIVLAACLIGNIFVCVTVMRNNEMRRKRWYYFLVNLAIADMGFALITPMHVLQSAGVNMGDAGCKIGLHLLNTTMLASTSTLAFISLHRYVNICLRAVSHMNRLSPLWINVSLWALAALISSPASVYCKRGVVTSCDCRSAYPSDAHYKTYLFTFTIVGFYIPFLTMLFCYTMITVRLVGKRGDRSGIQIDQSGKKKRSIKMMALATFLFFVALFPYTMLYLLKQIEVGDQKVIRKLSHVVQVIAFANCAWNPFIYCLLCKDFRNGFKSILCRKASNSVTESHELRTEQELVRA